MQGGVGGKGTCCRRRRRRQGSTGWLSGRGWNRGSIACAYEASPPAAGLPADAPCAADGVDVASAALRTTRCVTPAVGLGSMFFLGYGF